jgi:ribosomal-protein-alanine N-acetyltransferase
MADNSDTRAVERLSVREAKSEDLEEIYRIETVCFGADAYDPSLLLLYLNLSPDTFLVAEENGKIVGYVIGLVRKWGEGHVVSLAVHPKQRRKGVATALMKELLRRFSDKGLKAARLEVRVSNEAAIKLYEKLGFKRVGIIERYYADGEDAYLMVVQL